MTSAHIQAILTDIGIWGGATVPLLFLLYYTFCGGKYRKIKWWKTPAGWNFVALDIALLLVFVPLALALVHADNDSGWVNWLIVAGILAVPVITAWRIVALEIRRRQIKKAKSGHHSRTSQVEQTL